MRNSVQTQITGLVVYDWNQRKYKAHHPDNQILRVHPCASMVLLKLRISSSHSHSFRACQFVFEKSQTNALTFETPAFSKRMPNNGTVKNWKHNGETNDLGHHLQAALISRKAIPLKVAYLWSSLSICLIAKRSTYMKILSFSFLHGHCGNKLIFTSLINLGSELRSSTSFPLSQQLKIADMFDLPKQPAWTLEGGAAHAGRDCPLSWRS